MRFKKALVGLGAWCFFLSVGFFLTKNGIYNWDSEEHYLQSKKLLSIYFSFILDPVDMPSWSVLKWYGHGWELVLGIFTEFLFKFLHDPHWVRNSVTFTLLPTTFFILNGFLKKWGASPWMRIFYFSVLLSHIRWVGHSLQNTKDFPLACIFLISTFWMWDLWKYQRNAISLSSAIRFHLWFTFASLLPMFIRSVCAFHWIAGLGLQWYLLFRSTHLKKGLRFKIVIAPLIFSFLSLYFISPGAWNGHLIEWIQSRRMFKLFPWQGNVKVYGQTFPYYEKLPRWFIPSLLPLPWTGALSAVFAGVLLNFRKFPIFFKENKFLIWNLGFFLFPLIALLVSRPRLYSEDRHFLFLSLQCASLLGLVSLKALSVKENILKIISAALIAQSLWVFASWKRYAYIYKNPLLPQGQGHFEGDYWGLCLSEMTNRLADLQIENQKIKVDLLDNLVRLQQQKIGKTQPSFLSNLVFNHSEPVTAPYYHLSFSVEPYYSMAKQSNREKIHEIILPNGESICLISYVSF